MKVLVLAYEFPPIESAQALRWMYLCRVLAERGHNIVVLTANLLDPPATERDDSQLRVVRVFPGPFTGTAAALAAATRAGKSPTARLDIVYRRSGVTERAYRLLRTTANQLLVPDVRTEWLPWGLAAAKRLVDNDRPDIIIASHEPGVDLAVARRLQRRYRIPVVADVADPVVSAYTPRWRRRVDAYFERIWLSGVSAICVTTDDTREVLRHRLPELRDTPIEVLSQGFSEDPVQPDTVIAFDEATLELLYTGTLYARFRNPAPLVRALQRIPGVRLTVAGFLDGIDPSVLCASGSVRYLGRLPHEQVRAAQRQADVLVNIGNDFDVQIPGKLFEYMGAGRPILHIAHDRTDASIKLVEDTRCGTVAWADDIDGIVRELKRLRQEKRSGRLAARCRGAIENFSWRAVGARLESVLVDTLRRASHETGNVTSQSAGREHP